MSYRESFSRNIGLLSESEQEKLRGVCVAICGLGGVGGAYATTLARLGVGKFHIADFDVYEIPNLNRQSGAFHSTLGKSKASVMKKMILDINPEAEVTLFSEGMNLTNVDQFLKGVDAVADAIDFYELEARRLLFAKSREHKVPVVTSGPAGFTATLHVFTADSMSFEDYFDFASCRTEADRFAAFIAGITPRNLSKGQFLPNVMSLEKRKAPSLATAIQLCAGMACTQLLLLLIGRECHCVAPRFVQIDPVKGRLAKGILRWGNRSPLQLIRRKIAKQILFGKKA